MNKEAVTSWDLGAGGGANAIHNPVDPKPVLLTVPRGPSVEADLGPDTQIVTVDLWGLDPRLSVEVAVLRQVDPDLASIVPSYLLTEYWAEKSECLTATLAARRIGRIGGQVIPGAPLPADALFLNGGALDTEDDSCELCTGAQGVRFEVTATAAGGAAQYFLWRILLTAIVRPNVPIVCPDLFRKLAADLTLVRNGAPIKFTGTNW